MTPLPMTIRACEAGDVPFVRDTWMKSYRRQPATSDIPSELFFADNGHFGVVTRLIASCPVLVACCPEEPDAIYGWVCYGPGVLHYLYVKEMWRRQGVAKRLLEATGLGKEPLLTTHWTLACVRARASGSARVRWEPHRLAYT